MKIKQDHLTTSYLKITLAYKTPVLFRNYSLRVFDGFFSNFNFEVLLKYVDYNTSPFLKILRQHAAQDFIPILKSVEIFGRGDKRYFPFLESQKHNADPFLTSGQRLKAIFSTIVF